MPRMSARFMHFFFILLISTLACNLPTTTPTAPPASSPVNGTPASTQAPGPTDTWTPPPAGFPTDTPSLTASPSSTATLVPYKSPGPVLAGCASYQDASSCALNGCLWEKAAGACRNRTKSCSFNTTLNSCTNAGCHWNFKYKSCY